MNRLASSLTLACAALVLAAGCGVAPVEPSCTDKLKNGIETDVDCGGSCGPCATGATCALPHDCASATCEAQRCVLAPTCTDNVKNGTETAVDCGGSCATKCADGDGCAIDGDCGAGLQCGTNHLCGPKPLSCGDGLDCVQACTGTAAAACQTNCLQSMSPAAQQKLGVFTQCLDTACPTGAGGICNKATPGYTDNACQSCVGAALDTGAACDASFTDCVLDNG